MIPATRQLLSAVELFSYYRTRVPGLKMQGREWRGPCPIHEGKRDSFSVSAETGLWRCFSECADGGSIFDLEMKLAGRPFPEARTEVERIVGRVSLPANNSSRAAMKRRIVGTCDYTDESGTLLCQCVRFEPKDFRWRRSDGSGAWIWDLQGVRRVPYRLPEILKPEVVYTVEGEKDADRLWDWHIPATTAGAAGQWDDEHSKYLAGKQVVILFDNDQDGREDAIQRARSLLGVARAIKIVELPDLPDKGDISDWIEAGHTKEELAELVRNAPVLDEVLLAELERRWLPLPAETQRARRSITDLSQLPSVWMLESRLEWAVENLIPRGSVTMTSSESGTGKSWVAYAVAGAVARGQPFLGREVMRLPVLYLDGENPLYVVKDKLRNLGVEETPELRIWGGWIDSQPPGPGSAIIQRFAYEKKGLIIYDPLIAFHEGSEQDSTDTREFMDQFRSLANLGATVLVIHHSGKAETAKQYRGSSDIKASVDSAYWLKSLSQDEGKLDRLLLKCFKGRAAPGQDVAMEFRQGEGFFTCDIPDRAETTSEAIEHFLAEYPGANQKQIIEALSADGFSKQQVRQALKAGVESGHLSRSKGEKREYRYELAQETEDVVI